MTQTVKKEDFIEIINTHKRILYKIIYSYATDLEERKDLEQEILIQLWKSLKNYRNECQLSTWVYRVCLNVAISYFKKDLKRKTVTTSIDDTIFKLTEDNDQDDLEQEKMEMLYGFINKLDKLNKAIIILYLEDKNYQEISDIVGITVSNVGTKINRIKKKLKENFLNVKNS